ncbi:MAG TPA: hypothetical protein VGQ81_04680 [Acidobacteriota bacterium]|jgi:hypothetical protein|nr:hypothetical protein [Acidobacteriota bacterium]
MKISGQNLRGHVRLLKPLFALIFIVWLLRLLLYAAGSPQWLVTSASVTVTLAACVLLATALIHVRKFGGYTNVVLATVLLVAWTQLLIVGAIEFSVITGTNNIFSAPEYSFPGHDPSHLKHILGHLTFGLGFGTLIGAAVGCLLLFLLRLILPNSQQRA